MFWIGNLLWVALDGDEARGDDARFLPRLLDVEEAEEPKELEEDEEELEELGTLEEDTDALLLLEKEET